MYRKKIPYLVQIFNKAVNGVGLFPLYDLLRAFCSREFYDYLVDYLRECDKDFILQELEKVEDEKMRLELIDLLT